MQLFLEIRYMTDHRPMPSLNEQFSHDWGMMAVSNATMSVDSFFFLSGVLASYILMKHLSKNGGQFNLPVYYLHRYVRLTPALAAIIVLQISIFRRMGDGPFWFTIENTAQNCRETWWRNLLYIGNFDGYDPSKASMCVGQIKTGFKMC